MKELVAKAVSDCFGSGLMPRLRELAEYALASVVYHRQFVLNVVHSSHPARTNQLFIRPGLLDRLAEHVVLRYDGESPELQATGIPPHVAILKSLQTVCLEVDALKVRYIFKNGSIPALLPPVAYSP